MSSLQRQFFPLSNVISILDYCRASQTFLSYFLLVCIYPLKYNLLTKFPTMPPRPKPQVKDQASSQLSGSSGMAHAGETIFRDWYTESICKLVIFCKISNVKLTPTLVNNLPSCKVTINAPVKPKPANPNSTRPSFLTPWPQIMDPTTYPLSTHIHYSHKHPSPQPLHSQPRKRHLSS